MTIRINTFAGAVPKMDPGLLPPSAAQIAEDAKLERGILAPLRTHATVHTLGASAGSVHFHDGSWIGLPNIVTHAVPGPVATDRLYVTGAGSPRLYTDATTYVDLAIDPPASKCTATAGSVPSGMEDATPESTVFAYTFVSEQDEETSPSPLSDPIDLVAGQTATLTGFSTPVPNRVFDRLRIYISVTSVSGATDLYLIYEANIPTDPQGTLTDFSYIPASHTPQEIIPTLDYDTPPSSLAGIVSMPNGMMAAFSGKSLYFCEPYIPHAWPAKYVLKTDYPIVGLAAFGTMLAVLTEGTPYRVQGSHPDSMVMERIEENLPCVSARSIVDLGLAAVYASTEGLVSITASSAQILSTNLYTLDQWTALSPESIVAGRHSGSYIFTYSASGAPRRMAIVSLSGQEPYVVETVVSAKGFHHDIQTGKLYGLMSDGVSIIEWEAAGAAERHYTWRSKVFEEAFPVNFGAVLVQGAFSDPNDSGNNFRARVYADGDLLGSVTTLNTPSRLPADLRARLWEVEIVGNAYVRSVSVARTIQELKT